MKNLGSNKNGEISLVLINNDVESLSSDIGLTKRRNSGKSVFADGVPYPTIKQNTPRLTKSTDSFFMVTEVYERTYVLGINPMECTVAGTLATNSLFFLFLTRAFTLYTSACLFYKCNIILVLLLLVINLAHFTHVQW